MSDPPAPRRLLRPLRRSDPNMTVHDAAAAQHANLDRHQGATIGYRTVVPVAAAVLAADTRRVSSTARVRLSSAREPSRMWVTHRLNASASSWGTESDCQASAPALRIRSRLSVLSYARLALVPCISR